MTDVGEVAREMMSLIPPSLRPFMSQPQTIAFLAALHDIGKISPGFQRKCAAWLDENGLLKTDTNWNWAALVKDHGLTSQRQIQGYLKRRGVPVPAANALAAVLGGHHGRLRCQPSGVFSGAFEEQSSGIDWQKERDAVCDALWDHYGPQGEGLAIDAGHPGVWWLAGLVSVADWIGSDEVLFPPDQPQLQGDKGEAARAALNAIGWRPVAIRSGLAFEDIFGFRPNDLQNKAIQIIDKQGLYIIEAPMGQGKTEAALGAAYRLLETGAATGIYFALPTQITSNKIHERLETFVDAVVEQPETVKLIHGTSWLHELSVAQTRNKDRRDWFSSSKRALLARFGVGTVDQALLGVVAAKHFFVRRFALAGKVVILDEVHSYDAYTGCLIENLVRVLLELKCTVIILSATLTQALRGRLLGVAQDTMMGRDFPLLSAVKANTFSQTPAQPPAPKSVSISFQKQAAAQNTSISAADAGACVLWITDTVAQAQTVYEQLAQSAKGRFKVGLLHSRFPLWRRAEIEKEWLDRLGKKPAFREPCILVSTQIVEQSVDIDADLVISELAPIDMLLQRMGRLWRHERPCRPVAQPTFIVIEENQSLSALQTMPPDAIKACLGAKAYVYEPYVLLRTLACLRPFADGQALCIPSAIRELLDQVYQAVGEQPAGWQALELDMQGRIDAHRQYALGSANLWQPALKDDEGVQTRLNDRPMTTMVLCRKRTDKEIVLSDGQTFFLSKTFNLKFKAALALNSVKVSSAQVTASVDEAMQPYISGPFCFAEIGEKGRITNMTNVLWSSDLGVCFSEMKGGDL